MLGHGLATTAMRAQGDADSVFGITLNVTQASPASDDPADVDAARRVDGLTNRLFFDPLLRGSYPATRSRTSVGDGRLPHPGRRPETIHVPLDFLGINYYFRTTVRANDGATTRSRSGPARATSSRSSPACRRRRWAGRSTPTGSTSSSPASAATTPAIPLYITENGAAIADEKSDDGEVHDPVRIDYLDGYFRAAHRAIADGVDLRGYFVWSLMDNFEWAFGFSKRFGLIYVDFETLERTPKDSARWYAQVTRANGIPE
jgi:beta-glucosidase